jgi:hypothetical protein
MKNTTTIRSNGPSECTALILVLVLGMIGLISGPASAQTEGQRTFRSTQEAVDAFINAVRAGNNSELQAILGKGSEEIISSGDEVADKAARDRFVAGYDEKHSLVQSVPHQLTLNVGKDDWPFPIPLVRANGKWYFDGAAGKQEILYRRIGHNELDALKVCNGVVAAQRDYAASGHDGQPAGRYAQRLVSETGKQNGLYWEVQPGERPSPAGPFLAHASAEGYDTSGKKTPYHGYYYRLLAAQGSVAKGGAKSYVVGGRMTSGFALVAYPADYRSSGVMTFIVNLDDQIYQKDLGEKTAEIASQMTEYNPDKTWTPVK